MTTYNKFFIRSYASTTQIAEILSEHHDEIKAYAYIEHNHDDCEFHRHLVLYLERSKAKKTVENWFRTCFDGMGKLSQTRVECTKVCNKADGSQEIQTVDLKGATYYLVHEDKNGQPLPNKYHYKWEDVVSSNLDLLLNYEYGATKKEKKDCTFEILEALMSGTSLFELSKTYGRDFILNYSKYRDLAYSIECAEQKQREREIAIQEKYERDYLFSLLEGSTVLDEERADVVLTENERLRAILRANKIDF